MRHITTKVDVIGFNGDERLESEGYTAVEGVLDATIRVGNRDPDFVTKEWNDIIKDRTSITGRLNIIKLGSSKLYTRQDLGELLDGTTIPGHLHVYVYYFNALYPELDRDWDGHRTITKLGPLRLAGHVMKGCHVYSTIENTVAETHVRTDGAINHYMTQLLTLIEAGFGVDVVDGWVSFDIDPSGPDRPNYSLKEALECLEFDAFIARLSFTHSYYELMKDGYLDIDIKVVISKIEEFYRIRLGKMLENEKQDFDVLIKLAIGETKNDSIN